MESSSTLPRRPIARTAQPGPSMLCTALSGITGLPGLASGMFSLARYRFKTGIRIQFWPDFRNVPRNSPACWRRKTVRRLTKRPSPERASPFRGYRHSNACWLTGIRDSRRRGYFQMCADRNNRPQLSRIANNLSADWNPQDGYAHIISMAGSAGSPYSGPKSCQIDARPDC